MHTGVGQSCIFMAKKTLARMLHTRLTEKQMRTYEAAAQLCDQGVSSWVRTALNHAAVKSLKKANQPVPLFEKDSQ